MTTTSISKEQANSLVVSLNELEYVHPGNSACKFSRSISWHPRWDIIFDLIASVRAEHGQLLPMRDEIIQAVEGGKAYSFEDWGGGWSWTVRAVKVQGKVIRLTGGGACLYKGQHDLPVILL